MTKLRIILLGAPRLELDGRSLQIPRRKGLALLAYLAVTADEQRRDSLATLFWPESPTDKARGALRGELSHVNQILRNGWLEIGRDSVALSHHDEEFWLDVKNF